MIPITTLPAFRAAVAGGRLILITDSGTGDVLHHAPCSGLREEYFTEKVITNGGQNGSYFELQDDEPTLHGPRPCGLNCPQRPRRVA
jgi:hypothetical protein